MEQGKISVLPLLSSFFCHFQDGDFPMKFHEGRNPVWSNSISPRSLNQHNPLYSPSPPALNLSQLQVLFQSVNPHLRWPRYWSLSFSISPCNEYSGLISFRITSLNTLQCKECSSLLQHHSSKASIPQRSAFLMLQLSHTYKISEKIIFYQMNICQQSNVSAF